MDEKHAEKEKCGKKYILIDSHAEIEWKIMIDQKKCAFDHFSKEIRKRLFLE